MPLVLAERGRDAGLKDVGLLEDERAARALDEPLPVGNRYYSKGHLVGDLTETPGGDVMGAFTNNPGVAEFMQFLASK